jgi:hypothetical protein
MCSTTAIKANYSQTALQQIKKYMIKYEIYKDKRQISEENIKRYTVKYTT